MAGPHSRNRPAPTNAAASGSERTQPAGNGGGPIVGGRRVRLGIAKTHPSGMHQRGQGDGIALSAPTRRDLCNMAGGAVKGCDVRSSGIPPGPIVAPALPPALVPTVCPSALSRPVGGRSDAPSRRRRGPQRSRDATVPGRQ